MVFYKRLKPDVSQAVALVESAMEITQTYARDKKYRPTRRDVKLMNELLESLWQHHCTLEDIIASLPERGVRKR